MIPRNLLFLAVAFAMVLAVVASGDYREDYGRPKYTTLWISSSYQKGVVVGKVPALWNRYGAYWAKCAGEHYFQTKPAKPDYSIFYLRFTAFSGNLKGYKGYSQSCSEARDSVAVEYRTEGSSKWTTIATLKPESYRSPAAAKYKVSLYGNPRNVEFRFRSLQDCDYSDNDYGVWSFADLNLVAYPRYTGNDGGHGDDDDDDDRYHGNYGGGNKGGYGHSNKGDYGDDYDDDDRSYEGGNKGGYEQGSKGGYGDDHDDDDNHHGGGYDQGSKGSYGQGNDKDRD